MRLIEASSILIPPSRQRQKFEAAALHELAESIRGPAGLQHAPTLRPGIVPGTLVLVSGERRIRAMCDIYDLGGTFIYDSKTVPSGQIPYTLLSDLDDLAAEEAEFDENIKRQDLTWQERAAATTRLKLLREKIAARDGTEPPTIPSLTAELRKSSSGSSVEATRRELIVAQHLDKPGVRGAKSVDEAFKFLKVEEAKARNQTLAATVGRTFHAGLHSLHNADAREWLKDCPAALFDVILTDPPYGMGADEFGDAGGAATSNHAYVDTYETFKSLMDTFVPLSMHVTKPEAHLYCFCDIENFFDLRQWFSSAGWQVFRTPLIWHKPNGNRAPWPQHGPHRKHEYILYAIKGKRQTLKLTGDILTHRSDENLGHSAQKPVDLYTDLLSRSVHPGDRVLDICCGTGPIFPAAHTLQCVATGLEIDPANYGIAVKRLEALQVQQELQL